MYTIAFLLFEHNFRGINKLNNKIKLLFTFLATVPPISEKIFLNMFQIGSVPKLLTLFFSVRKSIYLVQLHYE